MLVGHGPPPMFGDPTTGCHPETARVLLDCNCFYRSHPCRRGSCPCTSRLTTWLARLDRGVLRLLFEINCVQPLDIGRLSGPQGKKGSQVERVASWPLQHPRSQTAAAQPGIKMIPVGSASALFLPSRSGKSPSDRTMSLIFCHRPFNNLGPGANRDR